METGKISAPPPLGLWPLCPRLIINALPAPAQPQQPAFCPTHPTFRDWEALEGGLGDRGKNQGHGGHQPAPSLAPTRPPSVGLEQRCYTPTPLLRRAVPVWGLA